MVLRLVSGWPTVWVVAGLFGALAAAQAPLTTPEVGSSHERMVSTLRELAEGSDLNPYLGEGPAIRLREQLEALPVEALASDRWLVMIQLAEEELRLGNEVEAIRLLTEARDLLPTALEDRSPLVYTQYRLGVAYLRQGETQNCALHPSADTCILPLRGAGIHSEQEPSRQAIAALTEVLQDTPAATAETMAAEAVSMNLAARWLLNLAYMTVGEYPDAVPAPYLIPPAAFESAHPFPRFDNIAPAVGLDTFDMSGGAIGDDFDNDGYLDIVVSTWDVRGQLRFFRNNQDGTFSERTEEAGLVGLYGGLNLVPADYDNDGNLDIFVLRGAWLGGDGRHPNSLLRNNGNAVFTDVTFEAGLGDVHYPTQTAAWGDYDNDGDLDLYIGNETSGFIVAPSQLFRNNGDGTFTDVASAAGVMNHAFVKAVVWGDYDGDRWPDLYVSSLDGPNRLYRNTGSGRFVDVAPQLGVADPVDGFPAWFWDFDNDGLLDLYASAYVADIEHLAAHALGLPVEVELARLYRGVGPGSFEEVARAQNLVAPTRPMGSNFGDLDNDGFLDFYLGTGAPPYQSLMPGMMFLNLGGQGFSDITYTGGFGHLQKGHAVVFADLDNDGDQDVFEQMGGAFPGDRFANALYENPGFGHRWITIKLVGVRSNRSAIGARIRAEIVEDGIGRTIYRHVSSGGSFGANPLRQTLGLGTASRLAQLEVFWPTTGETQTFSDVALDQAIEIVEGEDAYSVLELERVRLGSQGVGPAVH